MKISREGAREFDREFRHLAETGRLKVEGKQHRGRSESPGQGSLRGEPAGVLAGKTPPENTTAERRETRDVQRTTVATGAQRAVHRNPHPHRSEENGRR